MLLNCFVLVLQFIKNKVYWLFINIINLLFLYLSKCSAAMKPGCARHAIDQNVLVDYRINQFFSIKLIIALKKL